MRYNGETDKGEALSAYQYRTKIMQATLIDLKELQTKFGPKLLGIFRTDEGVGGEIWEAPEKNLIDVPLGSKIEIEKNNRGSGYRRVTEATVATKAEPKVDKKALAEYAKEQIKLLAYLHKTVAETFTEKGIELPPELVEKYAVTTYLKTTKTLGY